MDTHYEEMMADTLEVLKKDDNIDDKKNHFLKLPKAIQGCRVAWIRLAL